MPRLALRIAYDGTHFAGWQIQPRERTVQGSLEAALAKVCKRRIRVHGAGRTDSGVHALGQTAHCDIPQDKIGVPWRRAFNALLPEDVCVISAQWEDDSFHARYSAKSKIYSYTLWTAAEYVIPQRRPYVWPTGPLDTGAMQRVARVFLGRRDFAAMQNVGTPVAYTVRSVESIRHCRGLRQEEVIWYISADGFLKQMARIMMGCLVQAGRRRLNAEQMEAILDSEDRSRAPATAPARGLCLERVMYRETGDRRQDGEAIGEGL